MSILGPLLFSQPTPQELYAELCQKGGYFHAGRGFGKAFTGGYFDEALAINTTQKTVEVKDPDELLGIAKVYENGGELQSPAYGSYDFITINKDAYKAALCYALWLFHARTSQTVESDFHLRAEIENKLLTILKNNNQLKKLTYQNRTIVEQLELNLSATRAQTTTMLKPIDIAGGNGRIDNSAHGSEKAELLSGEKVIHKEAVGKTIACFEVAANELFRLIVGNHLPYTYHVYHERSEQNGIASRELKNFKKLSGDREVQSYFMEKRFAGFAKIGIAALYLQENDLHAGNIGTCEDEAGNRLLVKIDGDRAFFKDFTGQLHEETEDLPKFIRKAGKAYNFKEICEDMGALDGFGIDYRVLHVFPDLLHESIIGTSGAGLLNKDQYFMPFNWVAYGLSNAPEFNQAVTSIAYDPQFIREKYFTILKINLLPKALLTAIIDRANLPTYRTRLLDFLLERRQKLFVEALKIPSFKEYLQLNGLEAKETIKSEVHNFLELPENKEYLASRNPKANCYDEVVDSNFVQCVEKAVVNPQNPISLLCQKLIAGKAASKCEQLKMFGEELKKFDLNSLLQLAKNLRQIEANKADLKLQDAFAALRQQRHLTIFIFKSDYGNTTSWQKAWNQLKQIIINKLRQEFGNYPKQGLRIVLEDEFYQQLDAVMSHNAGRFLSLAQLMPDANCGKFKQLFTSKSDPSFNENNAALELGWTNLRK